MSERRTNEVNFGALGQNPAFQYWNDLVNVSMSLWSDQLMRWAGMWQRLATQQETPEQWIQDVSRLWLGWLSTMTGFAAFPSEWGIRRFMTVPNLVFMVDDVAETAAPQSAFTNITAEGLVVGATSLHRVGGREHVPSDKVQVELLDRGNRVQVTLVDLGHGLDERNNRLVPGLYLGVAYAYERPNMRPLALIYLHVSGPLQSGDPAPFTPPA
jgi:hypothetical protein